MILATVFYVAALRWEWFRLGRRIGFWVILALAGLSIVAILAVTAIVGSQSPFAGAAPSHGYPFVVFEGLSRLGPFLGIVVASLIFGGDFGWGTWRPLLGRGTQRQKVISPKLMLGGGIMVAVWIVAWCAAAVVGLVFGSDAARTIASQLINLPDGWWPTAILFFSGLPVSFSYFLLGALLCVVGRSTAFGVGVGIAIVIGEAVVYPLANTIAKLAWGVSLETYTRWTLWGVSDGMLGRDDLHAAIFMPASLAYCALFWALTLAIFSKRDLDSGNG